MTTCCWLGIVDLLRWLSNTASNVTHSCCASSRIPTWHWFGSSTLKHTLKASLCRCCVETIAFSRQYCGSMCIFTPAHRNLLPSPANECISPGLLPCRLSWDRDCLLADAVWHPQPLHEHMCSTISQKTPGLRFSIIQCDGVSVRGQRHAIENGRSRRRVSHAGRLGCVSQIKA